MNRLVVLLLIFSLAACGKPSVSIALPPPPETSRLSGQKETIARRRDAQAVEVLHGLSAGECYAAINSYLVKAELQKGEGGMSDD